MIALRRWLLRLLRRYKDDVRRCFVPNFGQNFFLNNFELLGNKNKKPDIITLNNNKK